MLAGMQGPYVRGGVEAHIELGSTGCALLSEIPSVIVTERVLSLQDMLTQMSNFAREN